MSIGLDTGCSLKRLLGLMCALIAIFPFPLLEVIGIRQGWRFVSSLVRALGKLLGGIGRFLPCSVGGHMSRLRHLGWDQCSFLLLWCCCLVFLLSCCLVVVVLLLLLSLLLLFLSEGHGGHSVCSQNAYDLIVQAGAQLQTTWRSAKTAATQPAPPSPPPRHEHRHKLRVQRTHLHHREPVNPAHAKNLPAQRSHSPNFPTSSRRVSNIRATGTSVTVAMNRHDELNLGTFSTPGRAHHYHDLQLDLRFFCTPQVTQATRKYCQSTPEVVSRMNPKTLYSSGEQTPNK